MNDSEIQQIANQLAANNRQMIIDEIDRRWRQPSGVVSGGPYGSFSVNDQGLVIDAGVGGGSSALNGVTAVLTSSYTPGSNADYINWDGVHYDSGTYWDISDPSSIYVPSNGVYHIVFTAFLQDCIDFGHGYININGHRRVAQTNYFNGLTKNSIFTVSQIRALSNGDQIQGEYAASNTPAFIIGTTIGGYSSLSVVRLGDIP